MPDGDQDARLIQLFEQALAQPAHRRESWARRACGADRELADRLVALLRADADDRDPVAELVGTGARWLEQSVAGMTGQRFGPWRVSGEIGHGGMGTVLAAERDDDEYRKRVAIKLIRGFPDRERLQRLRVERQILADLDHPNIARLVDGGSTRDGQPWLAIDFVDGEPIDRWCAMHRISQHRRARLLIQIASAVHFAHQQLIIHRDIKPANVLVTDDGTPKLLDFGIAKLLETADTSGGDTQMRYYTPNYSSPEQVGGRAVSTLSDVYSLGKLVEAVLRSGREKAALAREPAAIIARATATEPAERYPSASALAADLQRWLDGEAVQALAARRGYRLLRFVARHRVAVGACALAVVIAGGLVWRIVVESDRARRSAIRAEQTLGFLTGLIDAARPEMAQGRDVTVAQVLERGGTQLAADTDASPTLKASIAATLAGAWHALDEFSRAASLYRRAAELATEAGDTPAALRARAKALVAHTRGGRAAEVTEAAEALSADFLRLDPGDPALRADVLNDWAVWANEAGRVEQAREALLEVIELRRMLGDEATLAAAEHNLAISEDRLGNFKAALAAVESSLERKRRVLGPDHPSTLLGLRSLAVFAGKAGQFERASRALDTMLEQRIRLFGADNPKLSADYNERASALHDAGNYARAIALYQRALALDAQLDDQPARHIYLNNLAAAHEDRGDFAAAEPLLERSLALREQRFGTDHATTLRARHNLARLLLQLERTDRARSLADDTLRRYRRVLGPEHPATRNSRLLQARIRWAAAPKSRSPAPLMRAAQAVLDDAGPSSRRGLNARAVLARALLQAGRFDEAFTRLERIVDDYRAAFGPEHPRAARLQLQLARIDQAQGRHRAAEARLTAAAPVLRRSLVPDAPALALLACLREAGRDTCG